MNQRLVPPLRGVRDDVDPSRRLAPWAALLANLTAAGLVVLSAVPALAQEKGEIRPELQRIADAYLEDGDLAKAKKALEVAQATPAQLLATLRQRRKPTGDPTPGRSQVEIADGYGKKTNLLVIAPSAERIQTGAAKGLGLVVALHGLGGSNQQAIPIGTKATLKGDVVVVAPTAQRLAKREQTEDDGIPDLFKQRHWWSYDDPRGYVYEAIRTARERYPIDPDRIVLSGMSMGGYGTWNNGLRRPDRFAGLAPLAGGISRFAVKSDQDDVSKRLLENGRNVPVFSVHGDSDPVVPYRPDREACDFLDAIGAHVTFRTLEGVAHDLAGVYRGAGKVGDEVVDFIVTQRRKSSPETVTFVSLSERQDGAFWLRIATRSSGSKFPRIEGKVDAKKNLVQIVGTGVEKARVYLDDRLLDLEKPVQVAVGGVVRWQGKVEPRVEAILESWRSRGDESLVYPAFVELDPRDFQ